MKYKIFDDTEEKIIERKAYGVVATDHTILKRFLIKFGKYSFIVLIIIFIDFGLLYNNLINLRVYNGILSLLILFSFLYMLYTLIYVTEKETIYPFLSKKDAKEYIKKLEGEER